MISTSVDFFLGIRKVLSVGKHFTLFPQNTLIPKSSKGRRITYKSSHSGEESGGKSGLSNRAKKVDGGDAAKIQALQVEPGSDLGKI